MIRILWRRFGADLAHFFSAKVGCAKSPPKTLSFGGEGDLSHQPTIAVFGADLAQIWRRFAPAHIRRRIAGAAP